MRRTTPGVFSPAPSAALPHSVDVVEGALLPLVLPERLARIDAVARARIASVVVVLEALVDPHNVAAVLRTADALGVGEVHLIDLGVRPLLASSVTRGCERWMDVLVHRDAAACVAALHARGFAVHVADVRARPRAEDVAVLPRVALAFGNEHLGASAALRAAADGAFGVPMRGMTESLNVSVAAGIALHLATRDRQGDLGESEARALRARFLMESVRHPKPVIERYLRDRAGS